MLSITRAFRKYERWIMFGILILTALAFGITGTMLELFNKDNKENYAGEVFGERISILDFNNCRARWSGFTQWCLANYRPWFFTYASPFDTVDISLYQKNQENYLNELTWNVLILSRLADQAGFTVSIDEVSEYIKSSPQLNNKERGFSKQDYDALLARLQMPPAVFEQTATEFLKIHKYRSFILESITASTEESFNKFMDKNDELKISWIAFKSDDFISKIRGTTVEEIKEYYERNAKTYEIPLKVQMEYIFACTDDIKKEITAEPTKEETDEYFNKRRTAEFKDKTPDQVKDEVKSGVLKQKANDLALERIGQAEVKIRELSVRDKPISLQELASEFKLKYNQTGWFTTERLSEMEKEFGASPFLRRQLAAFKEGETSDNIITDKGYLVFRLMDKKDAYLPILTAQIKEKVQNDLIKEKATNSSEGAAKRLMQSIKDKVDETAKALSNTDSASLIKIRKDSFVNLTENAFPVKTTGYFKHGGPLQLVETAGTTFFDRVYKLQEGEFEVISEKSSDGKKTYYYLVQVLGRRPAAPSNFYARQKELTSTATYEKREEFLKEWRASLRPQANWQTYQKQTR